MKDFMRYSEPLYVEIDNEIKRKVVDSFDNLIKKRTNLMLILFDDGEAKISDMHFDMYGEFLFSKLDSLGDATDAFLLVDSKISTSSLKERINSDEYKGFRYRCSLYDRLTKEVGGSLLFRSNDSDMIFIVD
ncbi:hypothetical protein [Shewanella fidelis]|uniref:hypothetical protein n=1 Tax=Shewanella fidelis TaxID=173509 RepID=UPI00048D65F6|nr:hypothetical protein [Shewanella fidelis]